MKNQFFTQLENFVGDEEWSHETVVGFYEYFEVKTPFEGRNFVAILPEIPHFQFAQIKSLSQS